MFFQFGHSGASEYYCKEYGENFNFPYHLHRSFEFITILSGEMRVSVDKREYLLEKGDSLLIFPGQWAVNFAIENNEGLVLSEFNKW